MGKTVVGVFDGYDDAMRGQGALIDAGFQQACICVYSDTVSSKSQHGPRIYSRSAVGAHQESPALEQVERLFQRLFTQGKYPPESAHYREVIRRGGAILSIDIADEQAESARDAMVRAGSIDIDERVAAWQRDGHQSAVWDGPVRRTPVGENDEPTHPRTSARADSAASPDRECLEPLRGSIPGGAGARASSQAASQRNDSEPVSHHPRSLTDALTGQTTKVTSTTRAAPRERIAESEAPRRFSATSGSPSKATEQKAVSDAGMGTSSSTDIGDSATADDSTQRFAREDDIRGYDEEIDHDYDTRNPTVVLPYEDGERGHRHGTARGSDSAYEPSDWASPGEFRTPQRSEVAEPQSGWERFKTAVRHGWERMTGDHRGHRHT